MKITKLGHCCLLIEVKGVSILTDPGAWTDLPEVITGLSAVLITHEHSDHVHIESLAKILSQNPSVKVYTNSGVGALLEEAGIKYELLKEEGNFTVNEIPIRYFACDHASLYQGIDPVPNTPFLLDNRLFYPGDAFFDPKLPVEILALPVSGPWLRIDEVIDYAKLINPKIAFPVHDGMLKHVGPFHFLPGKFLKEAGIDFKALLPGDALEVA